MEWISLLSIFVTAVATCVIAYFSRESTRLAEEIKKCEESYRTRLDEQTRQHQSELRELCQAIIFAAMVGGHSNTEGTIKAFKEVRKRRSEIFGEG